MAGIKYDASKVEAALSILENAKVTPFTSTEAELGKGANMIRNATGAYLVCQVSPDQFQVKVQESKNLVDQLIFLIEDKKEQIERFESGGDEEESKSIFATIGLFAGNVANGFLTGAEGIVDGFVSVGGFLGGGVDAVTNFITGGHGTDIKGAASDFVEWTDADKIVGFDEDSLVNLSNAAQKSYISNDSFVMKAANISGTVGAYVTGGYICGGLLGKAASGVAKIASGTGKFAKAAQVLTSVGSKIAGTKLGGLVTPFVADATVAYLGGQGETTSEALENGATFDEAFGAGAVTGLRNAGISIIAGNLFRLVGNGINKVRGNSVGAIDDVAEAVTNVAGNSADDIASATANSSTGILSKLGNGIKNLSKGVANGVKNHPGAAVVGVLAGIENANKNNEKLFQNNDNDDYIDESSTGSDVTSENVFTSENSGTSGVYYSSGGTSSAIGTVSGTGVGEPFKIKNAKKDTTNEEKVEQKNTNTEEKKETLSKDQTGTENQKQEAQNNTNTTTNNNNNNNNNNNSASNESVNNNNSSDNNDSSNFNNSTNNSSSTNDDVSNSNTSNNNSNNENNNQNSPSTNQKSESNNPLPGKPLNQTNNGSGNYHTGGSYTSDGGYQLEQLESTETLPSDTVNPVEDTLQDTTASIDDVIKENYTKIPSSSDPITTGSSSKGGGSTIIPVIAGLSAAAAAGIGAKAYLDRKENNDNDEDSDEIETEEWSGEDTLDLEYDNNETQEAYLDDDDDYGYQSSEPVEKYDARSNEELADLQ